MKRRLLTVFSHPDDESFGISGTIARYAQQGAEVYHICATRGEAGSARPLGLSPLEFGAMREMELRRASRILGFKRIWVLGYPDSGLKGLPREGPAQRILRIIEEVKPQVIITFGSTGITGHPDHIAIHHWVTEAYERAARPGKLYYTALLEEYLKKRGLPLIKEKITTIISVEPYLFFKRRAIHCHRSQWAGAQRVFSFAGGSSPLSKEDYFIRAKGLGSSEEIETDFFS